MAQTDREFLQMAFRDGKWERFEHPERGDTLTLYVGKFPLLSIHNLLVERAFPVGEFQIDMRDIGTMALLLAKVAKLEEKLEIATKIIANHGLAEEFDD